MATKKCQKAKIIDGDDEKAQKLFASPKKNPSGLFSDHAPCFGFQPLGFCCPDPMIKTNIIRFVWNGALKVLSVIERN